MHIDLNSLQELTAPGMNGGAGRMSACMFVGERGKIIPTRIHPGGSIGAHRHDTSDDISYVLSGGGVATCNDVEEPLSRGVCHICPKGSEHSIANTEPDDFELLTIVVER